MAAAVSSMRVNGRKARRTANQARKSDPMSANVPMTAVVTSSRTTVWFTVLNGMPTANVAFAPVTRPATKRHLSGPDSEGTVNGSPLRDPRVANRQVGQVGRGGDPGGQAG